MQALIGAGPGDAVRVRAEVPDAFLDQWARFELPVPGLLQYPEIDPARRYRPFGWGAEAIETNLRHDEPTPHPPLSCVRRVNSRSFALRLERELLPEVARGEIVDSHSALVSFLERSPAESRWVVKSEHGNAGLANRRMAHPLSPSDRRFVEQRLREDDRLLVEPWYPRERDFSAVFEAPFDPSSFRMHETFCTRNGALIGALFEPGGGELAPWLERIGGTAERVAGALSDEGYFGPACLDGFVWRDERAAGTRTLVDLNCRRSMSDGAHRLWDFVAPDRVLYYRFFNRRRLGGLPGDLPRLIEALGSRCYDPVTRAGILPATPLWLGRGKAAWRPGKQAVIFVADSRSRIRELEEWFRESFEV